MIYVGETEIKPNYIDMVLPFAKHALRAIYQWLVSGLVSSMIVEILASLFKWQFQGRNSYLGQLIADHCF